MTPSRAGGSAPPSSRRPSSARDTPLAGGRSSWDAAAAAPELARAGGGGGNATGGYKPRSSVRFDVERSPALTPAWKSSSWAKAAPSKRGERRDVERSPDLAEGRGGAATEADVREREESERQLDRDWYDQVGADQLNLSAGHETSWMGSSCLGAPSTAAAARSAVGRPLQRTSALLAAAVPAAQPCAPACLHPRTPAHPCASLHATSAEPPPLPPAGGGRLCC